MPDRILGMRRDFVIFVAIVLYTIAPVISVLIAGTVAHACGCQLNEGNVNPCKLFGIEIGELLTAMGVAGWLFLMTLPTGVLAMVAFLFATFSSWLLKRRKASEPQNSQ